MEKTNYYNTPNFLDIVIHHQTKKGRHKATFFSHFNY
jgi:hypothetical protein